MIRVRVPGKLLLAGEYAILEPGASALVLGVNRYFYATIEPNPEPTQNVTLRSLQHDTSQHDTSASFEHPRDIDAAQVSEYYRFCAAACRWTLAYLDDHLDNHLENHQRGFTLTLNSQLQQGKIKLGLGSSAACCVATVAALLQFYGQPLHRPTLFKLAYLAHHEVQGSGSGADIAGCVYGSAAAYVRPDLDALPRTESVHALIKKDWPLLHLESLKWPMGPLYFGWTGQSASSKAFIEDFHAWKKEQPEAVHDFCFQMQMAVMALKETLLTGSSEAFVHQISAQRRLLQILNTGLIEPPETNALKALAEEAEALGGAGKFSGAGGGDCGLAWVPVAQKEALFKRWKTHDITPLDLVLDIEGTQRVDAP